MLRVLIVMVLTFALPYIVYWIISLFQPVETRQAPKFWLALVGVGCALAALFVFVLMDSSQASRTGAYQPPSLQDGEVRPGRFEPKEPPEHSEDPSMAS